MSVQNNAAHQRMFEELQELVAMEMKDILATATEQGFEPRDVLTAVEMALQAEIEALAQPPENAAPNADPAAIAAETDEVGTS